MSSPLTLTYRPLPALEVPVIDLPLSKSISNRLLILNALGKIPTPSRLVADCDDTTSMLKALSSEPTGLVDIGAAGTAMRFLTAYYAVLPGSDVILDGSPRMRQRPIGPLVDALRQLGAHIEYKGHDGFPPVHVRGHLLEGGAVEIDGSISSQYTSALLMAAPAMTLGCELTLKGSPVSMSYIMMTLNMMAQRGARISMEEAGEDILIKVMPGLYNSSEGNVVEADWSAASYWYEYVALTGKPVALKGLSRVSLQGDAALTYLYEVLGVAEHWDEDGTLVLNRSGRPDVDEFEGDMTETPDLAQTIMATCCGINLPFTLTGLSTLAIKETNRIEAMITELGKLGFVLTTDGHDTVSWDGTRTREVPPHPVINTYKDHRMAMSLAPLAAVTGDTVTIDDPEVVSKSYPQFWNHLKEVGFRETTE